MKPDAVSSTKKMDADEKKLPFEIKGNAENNGTTEYVAERDGKRVAIARYKPGDVAARMRIAKSWAADDRLRNGLLITSKAVAEGLERVELAASEIDAGSDDDRGHDQGEKTPKVSTVSWRGKNSIAELAYNRQTGRPDFIICNTRTAKVRRAPQIKTNRRLFVPPSDWARVITPGGRIEGTILVPDEYDETGLDESRLRQDVLSFIRRYVELPADAEHLAVEYVLLTWVHDAFDELPYLAFRTADMGRGKSRALEAVGAICYRPILCGGGSTAAATLRLIDTFGGTMLCDEFDLRDTDLASAISKIINQGFQRNRPILKCSGEDHTPTPFRCFGPKIFALRKGLLDDASESRTLSIRMKQRTRRDIPINLPRRRFDAEALRLRNRLLAWRFANLDSMENRLLASQTANPVTGKPPKGYADNRLEDRFNQIGTPLMIVAGERGGDRIVAALLDLQGDLAAKRTDTLVGEVFEAVRAVADEDGIVRPGAVAAEVNRVRCEADGIYDHYSQPDPSKLGKRRLTANKAGWVLKSDLELERLGHDERGKSYRLTAERRAELCRRFGVPPETSSTSSDRQPSADRQPENTLFGPVKADPDDPDDPDDVYGGGGDSSATSSFGPVSEPPKRSLPAWADYTDPEWQRRRADAEALGVCTAGSGYPGADREADDSDRRERVGASERRHCRRRAAHRDVIGGRPHRPLKVPTWRHWRKIEGPNRAGEQVLFR